MLPSQAQAVLPPMRADRIQLPPERRVFQSPSSQFNLTLLTDDHWQTRRAIGQLCDHSKLLWRCPLPQTLGPRHAVVTDHGEVVLIDDWINVPSTHALVLMGSDGHVRASYSIDELIAVLGVSRATVAKHGQLGIWLSAMPQLSTDGILRLPSSGRTLELRLADGTLSSSD